jgi:hypothetical protein
MLAPRSDFLWHRILLNGQLQLVRSELDELCRCCPCLTTAAELIDFEQRIQQLTQKMHALLAANAVQSAALSGPRRQATHHLLASLAKPLKNQGWRPVCLRFAQGPEVVVYLPYYSRSKAQSNHRGKGCFPTLLLLGIYDHCSPALASDLAQLTALLGSFQEARLLLRQRGVCLSANRLRRVVYHYARRVRLAQPSAEMFPGESLKGRVVVLTTDGGRLRIRKDRKAKTKKGRKRYSTQWREPKLLMIYTVKRHGGQTRIDKSFVPVIDGTLGGPDALFQLMRYYLEQLKITQADKVLVVADGARWIWKRVASLLRSLKVAPEKIHQAVDFYHAMEHLGSAADLAKCFSAKQKKKWLKTQSHRLLSGETDKVVAELEELAAKQPSKKMTTELGYFVRHAREHKRMEYATLAKTGLPLGSGAIESAVRRVINLRLKGAGIFWHKHSAEAMLLLRSFAKAGRLQHLHALAFAPPNFAASESDKP